MASTCLFPKQIRGAVDAHSHLMVTLRIGKIMNLTGNFTSERAGSISQQSFDLAGHLLISFDASAFSRANN